MGGRVVAHNASFERVIWNHVIYGRGKAPVPMAVAQMDCTMARAYAIGLPPGLELLASVLQSPIQKDMDGHKAMMALAKPKKTKKGLVFNREPALIERAIAYGRDDVGAESFIDTKLLPLSDRERRVWELDQEINDRGVRLDVVAIERAMEVVTLATAAADAKMQALTGNAIEKCSQAAAIVTWLNGRGIETDSVAKAEEEDLMVYSDFMNDATAGEVVKLRREAAKASTAKLRKMAGCVNRDGRSRGTLMYHGAGPGRWAGRLWQPQNLPRVDAERDAAIVEGVFAVLADDVLSGEQRHELIASIVGPVLPALAKCLRGMVVASPGNRLVGGDLSNIEGRVNAYLADEEWKVQAFRDQDAGGPDNYKLTYARSFAIELGSVTGAQRQIGKVQELASGYQGSIGAYLAMAAVYGLKPDVLARAARAATDDFTWAKTAAQYDKPGQRRYGLTCDVWTGIKVTVDRWRRTHPMIVQSWWDLQDAAIAAVANPSIPVHCLGGRVAYISAHGFLWCQLPSKRLMAYAQPHLRWEEVPKFLFTTPNIDTRELVEATPDLNSFMLYDDDGRPVPLDQRTDRRRRQVVHNVARKGWWPRVLYGGLQCENIVQATARDVLVEGMFRANDAGYPIVLTVHDELVTDMREGYGSAQELAALMSVVPDWCPGLPLAAKAWEDKRYVK